MNKFHEIQNNHLALTQYHRWYQVYEQPFTKASINNQLDILADDVEISSAGGTMKGKDNLPERLKMYEGWQNAHHVQNTAVELLDNDTLKLEADILYQNIRPDDSQYSYSIHYSTTLQLRENDLPVFKTVSIRPTGSIEPPQFVSAYPENRAKSFMHYWLYLMETIESNAYKFKELLAENFELHLSTSSMVDTLDKFNEWATSVPKQIKASSHFPKNLLVKENTDKTISVSVDFEWEGISVDDKPMIAETHHEWILENNPDDRFAKMKRMDVVQTKPFQVVVKKR
jgi:hypothetical protein